MESAPVRSAILRLALPTMLGMLLQTIYNLTDMFYIGQLKDKDLVAAITLIIPLFLVIQALGGIFAVGAGSYISRKLGERDFDEARHANSVSIYSSAVLGVFVTVLMVALRDPILHTIGTSDATFGPTREYYTIIAAFSTLLMLQVSMSGLVRSEGATGRAMIGMVIGLGANIVLDPVFIFVFGLGVAGAAWATVIGNFLGTLYFVGHFLSKQTVLSIRFRDFKPSKRLFAESLKIGLPAALSTLIMSVSMVLSNVVAKSYSDFIVAGNGAQMRVNSMCIMLLIGLAQGYQPFAGYNYGAKNYHRLMTGLKTTMVYSTVLACFFSAVFLLFGREILSVIITNPDEVAALDAGTKILHAFSLGAPFIGLQMTMMVTFQASGKAVRAMLLSLGRQCLLYIPLLFALNALLGFSGYIFAQPIADVLSAVAALLMSLSFLREMRARHQDEHGRVCAAAGECGIIAA
jgi:putative MATE family efflux protein